jgi:hypothetical protein
MVCAEKIMDLKESEEEEEFSALDMLEFGSARYTKFVQSSEYNYASGSRERVTRVVPAGKLATQS